MTRQEHLDWCKKRALEYLTEHDTNNAVASMLSDMRKHPETADHIGCQLGISLLVAGHLNSETKVREWIVGFN